MDAGRPADTMARREETTDFDEEQAEFNLGSMREAFDGAVEAATQAMPEAPSAEVVAAARERAEMLLRAASPEDAAGLEDLKKLHQSMGLPAARALFRHLITASKNKKKARAAEAALAAYSDVTEQGCMRVEYHDRLAQKPAVAYLLLGECPKDHDFGAQLEKLRARCADDKWPSVLQHLSALLAMGRHTYAMMAAHNAKLIRRLHPGHGDYATAPKVDPANTTLYFEADWPMRVGIFVELED